MQSKAAALEFGDMVLVHVTTFKGCHKIQNQWKREYVVERQPYPNVPVYVACPRDGEGHSQTLHRNYVIHQSQLRAGQGLSIHVPQPQCHKQTVSPLTQSHPGWPCQMQWTTYLRVVQTNLLHSDMAHMQHRTNFHGGTRISHYWQIPVCLALWMHGLVCVFVSI